jgi:hypothetical protein
MIPTPGQIPEYFGELNIEQLKGLRTVERNRMAQARKEFMTAKAKLAEIEKAIDAKGAK